MHHFLTAEARYSDPRHNEDMGLGGKPDRDEAKTTLEQVVPDQGVQFGYECDFGDSWEHEITVEKILPPDAAAVTVALCLGGARACPPEDCGGVWSYPRQPRPLLADESGSEPHVSGAVEPQSPRFQLHEKIFAFDRVPDLHVDSVHNADRCGVNRGLHLHGFHHQQFIAFGNLRADGD